MRRVVELSALDPCKRARRQVPAQMALLSHAGHRNNVWQLCGLELIRITCRLQVGMAKPVSLLLIVRRAFCCTCSSDADAIAGECLSS